MPKLLYLRENKEQQGIEVGFAEGNVLTAEMKSGQFKWSPKNRHYYKKANSKDALTKTRNFIYELQQKHLVEVPDGLLSEIQTGIGENEPIAGFFGEPLQDGGRGLSSGVGGGVERTRSTSIDAEGTDPEVAVGQGLTDTNALESGNESKTMTQSVIDNPIDSDTVNSGNIDNSLTIDNNADIGDVNAPKIDPESNLNGLIDNNDKDSTLSIAPIDPENVNVNSNEVVHENEANKPNFQQAPLINNMSQVEALAGENKDIEIDVPTDPDLPIIEIGQDEDSEEYNFHKMLKNSSTGNFILPKDAMPLNFTENIALDDNIRAMEVLVELLSDRRPATLEEQGVLSHWRGWGGVKDIMYVNMPYIMEYSISDEKRKEKIKRAGALLKQLDGLINGVEKEFKKDFKYKRPGQENAETQEAAALSALNAHYTHPQVVKAIWQIVENAGFNGGRILEPSAGIGTFLGMIPEKIRNNSTLHAVEKDLVTGHVLSYLYPHCHTQIMGLEAATLPNGYFDLIISNIPFGKIAVFDKQMDKNKSVRRFQNIIHQYFFVKSIELLAEGGLIVFITSKGCLESSEADDFRAYLNDNTQFVGAIRLPAQAQKTIAGTEVTADLIILQKKSADVTALQQPDFLNFKEVQYPILGDADTKFKISANDYFVSRPKQVIGKTTLKNLYGNTDESSASASMIYVNYVSENDNTNKKEVIFEIAAHILTASSEFLFAPIYNKAEALEVASALVYSGKYGDFVTEGNLVFENSNIFRIGNPLPANKTWEKIPFADGNDHITLVDKQKEILKNYITLRTALKKLYDAEIAGKSDVLLNKYRENLNYEYDFFVQKHGFLHLAKNRNVILYDIDATMVLAIEISDTEKKWRKAGVFTERTLRTVSQKKAQTLDDAISIVLNDDGPENINLAQVAFLLKKEVEELDLQDKLYETPEGKWQTADFYGSGNVYEKLLLARAAAELDGKFKRNVSFLESRMPPRVNFLDIPIQIGEPIIPIQAYQKFVDFIFGRSSDYYVKKTTTGGDSIRTGQINSISEGFKIIKGTEKASDRNVSYAEQVYAASKTENGVKKVIATTSEILEAALNGKILKHTVKSYTPDGKETSVVDEEGTNALNASVDNIKTVFLNWLEEPAQADIRSEIEEKYNATFNIWSKTKYDGSFLTFPGYAQKQGFDIHGHVKDAVWMLMCNNGGVVDHTVGAGKTSVMIFSIMKMKQAGIIRKPVMALLKATVPQIVKDFKEYYPNAKILSPSPSEFSQSKREEFLNRIASENWDCVILSHEQLMYLPVDAGIEKSIIKDELWLLGNAIDEEEDNKTNKRLLKTLQAKKERLQARLNSLLNKEKDNTLSFDALGIDHLMVDESHKFKNLQYFTSHGNVAGLGPLEGSSRAFQLYILARSLNKIYRADKGITFLSGTPITNSLVEMFSILRFIAPTTLQKMNIDTFDKWAATFAVKSNEIEFDVSGALKQKIRYRQFIKVLDLSRIYTAIADVRTSKTLPDLRRQRPGIRNGQMQLVKIPISCEQQKVMIDVAQFMKLRLSEENKGAALVGKYTTARGRSLMASKGLLSTNIAAKAALDMRLLLPGIATDYGNKTAVVAQYVAAIYHQSTEAKGVQLIFCDMGTPNAGNSSKFTVYEELKKQLTELYKIPYHEIQFIHDYQTDKSKLGLFKALNNGEVRILMGSTDKAGTGLNVQKRIVALHHIDLRWTPAALDQRNGRGIRKGNLFQMVEKGWTLPIFVYATERTLDAYKFDLVKQKQAFIEQIREGTITSNVIDEGDANSGDGDGESATVSYATYVAEITGNPALKKEAVLKKQIKALKEKEKAHKNTIFSAQNQIDKYDGIIAEKDKKIKGYTAEIEEFKEWQNNINATEITLMLELDSGSNINEIPVGNKYTYKNGLAGLYSFLTQYVITPLKKLMDDDINRLYVPSYWLRISRGQNNAGWVYISPNIIKKVIVIRYSDERNFTDYEYFAFGTRTTFPGISAERFIAEAKDRIGTEIEQQEKYKKAAQVSKINEQELYKNALKVVDKPFLFADDLRQKEEEYKVVSEEVAQSVGKVTIAEGECRAELSKSDINPGRLIKDPKTIYDLGVLPDISTIEQDMKAKFEEEEAEAEAELQSANEGEAIDTLDDLDSGILTKPAPAPKPVATPDKQTKKRRNPTPKLTSEKNEPQSDKPANGGNNTISQVDILKKKINLLEMILKTADNEFKVRIERQLKAFRLALELEEF